MRTYLLPILCLIFISCIPKENKIKTLSETTDNYIEYYSTIPLRESPYPDFQGVVRLSKADALTRNHYRLEYGKNFKLKSISFWNGNKLNNPNHTANYFFTAPVQKFEYKDNQEIITYYDKHNNQIKHRGAHKSIYTTDNYGRRISLHYEDDKGETVENNWGISKYVWNHQNDGSLLETRFNLNGDQKPLRPGFQFFKIRLSYEPNGLLALMQNINEKGDIIGNSTGAAQDKMIFDNEGRWLGWYILNAKNEIHKGNGPNVAKGLGNSNFYGYETGIRYEDVDGTPINNSHGFWGSKRFYDKYGNYDYTYFTDGYGNPSINEKSGYCYAYYTYDDKGYNRLKIELKDVNKKPIPHKRGGYANITYEYDNNDNLIKANYLGVNNEKINRKDNGVSYIIYKYENNLRTETLRYDKLGNKIN